MHWESRDLTTGPPGKFLSCFYVAQAPVHVWSASAPTTQGIHLPIHVLTAKPINVIVYEKRVFVGVIK